MNIIFDSLGWPVSKLMNSIKGLINTSNFPETLALLILILMVYFIIDCAINVLPLLKRLKSITEKLKINEDEDKIAAIANFENELFTKNDIFTNEWKNYKKNTYRISDDIVFTIKPNEYFNESSLGFNFYIRNLEKWSGFFVGFGLLITFLGIVSALDIAATDMTAAGSDINKTTEALNKLLKAASFKFITSVFGLFAALIINIIVKYSKNKVKEKIDLFCDRLDDLLVYGTTESLLAQQLFSAQQTTTELKQLNSEAWISSLAGRVDSALHQNLLPLQEHLDIVGKNIGNMEKTFSQTISDNLQNMQEKTLDMLADKLGNVVGKHAGSQLTGLANTLEQLTGSLSGMQGALETGGGNFANTIEMAVTDLRSGVSGLAAVAQNISQNLHEEMGTAQRNMQTQMESISQTISNQSEALLNSFATAFSDAMKELRGAISGFAEATSNISAGLGREMAEVQRSLQENVATMGEQLTAQGEKTATAFATTFEKTLADLKEGVDGLSSVARNIGNGLTEDMQQAQQILSTNIDTINSQIAAQGESTATKISESTNYVIGKMQDTFSALNSQVDHLTNAMQQASSSMNNHSHAVSEAATQTDNSAKVLLDASRAIQAAVLPVESVIGEIANNIAILRDTISTMIESVKASEETIGNSTENLEQIWSTHIEHFNKVDVKLADTLMNVNEHIRTLLNDIAKFVDGVDSNFSDALTSLSGDINELKETLDVENMQKSIAQQQTLFVESINNFTKSINSLTVNTNR